VNLMTNPQEIFTEEDKLTVEAQVERLLATPYFSHSRRFPSFLRFIVEQTIAGNAENLKERTLGIEIFGKSADYDTANDPIVRVTAAEIRKRIAQYYQDPGHQNEMRISLPPGSYIPQFNLSQSAAAALEEENLIESNSLDSTASPDHTAKKSASRLSWITRRWKLATAVVLLLVVTFAFLAWRQNRRAAFAEFWDPIITAKEPVLFCVADQPQYTSISLRDADDPARQVVLNEKVTAVVIDDLNTITKIAGVLQSEGRQFSVRGESTTNLTDLRNGPSVFVGAYDNAWTLRMLQPLRYHFSNNSDMTIFSILDSSVQKSRWVVDRKQQIATGIYMDYAIVARFTDATTGKPTLIAAGIGRGGTNAAGEFLTNPELMQIVRNQSHSSKLKNVEVVLSTQIINDEPGTPKIEAVYYW
jgi:hypothetical protein